MRTIAATALAAALLFALPHQAARAQTPPPPAAAPAQQTLTAGQLDALVSPIALYPDALLSEVLMASTYPLEVVEADRWAKANKNLQGDALKAAIDQQAWDDSVKSLAATPEVLDMMSSQLSWTQQLGDAVLAQQPDVMDAIQRLRVKAQANNKLMSNKQQTVTTQDVGGRQYIAIAPTDPDDLYVPYYDPAVVYGPWGYPDYPPYYWPPPAYIGVGVLATGLAFGAGYAIGRWSSGGCCWGGGFNWGNRNINVNRNVNNVNVGNAWTHNPAHRGNVGYSNPGVAAKFGGTNRGGGNQMNFRGSGGQQVLQPGGGNRSNAGAGAGTGNRNVGTGAGNTSFGNNAGNRSNQNRSNAGTNRSNAGTHRSNAGTNRVGGGGGASNARRVSGGGGGGAAARGGGGGAARGGGGGAARGGGGAGRRSDIRLKHDIVLLGRLDRGIGFYRFVYNGGSRAYVGVMAQEVAAVMPDAVRRGGDGYLRVYYDKLGVKFQSYDAWIASGARLPAGTMLH